MPTIGGNVCIRNGTSLDYCWKESVLSLLPVCDSVVVCDGESDDGTYLEIQEWAGREPKLAVCVYKWQNPKGDVNFWTDWLNYARIHLHTDWHLQLDADEVLHEKSYPEILEFVKHGNRSAICTRHNFWLDHRHTIPDGVCVGKQVYRLAPQRLWMPSDAPNPLGDELCGMTVPSAIEIFHYGCLRKRQAFFDKAKLIQGYFFNSYDPRLDVADKVEGSWMAAPCMAEWNHRLDPFTGTHPAIMKGWLAERGYPA